LPALNRNAAEYGFPLSRERHRSEARQPKTPNCITPSNFAQLRHAGTSTHRRRIRLHHRRRRLGRLRAGEPAQRQSEKPRADSRGGRPRQLDLVPHPGRLPVRDRQSALRLDVQDRAGAGPQRPRAELSARQGDRWLVVDQRDDLHARPVGRLRPLAAARADRLGLGRRAAFLQEASKSFNLTELSDTSKRLTVIGDLWRNFAYESGKICKQRTTELATFNELAALLKDISKQELTLFNDLFKFKLK